MTTVTDSLFIAAPVEQVYEYCWNATWWPRITPHVRDIELVESSDTRQRMKMAVESDGKMYHTESVRESSPQQWIAYRQLTPPVFLEEHTGEWRFADVDGGTRVDLVHRFTARPELARQALGLGAHDDVEAGIGARLKRNGLMTLSAVKSVAERHAAGAQS